MSAAAAVAGAACDETRSTVNACIEGTSTEAGGDGGETPTSDAEMRVVDGAMKTKASPDEDDAAGARCQSGRDANGLPPLSSTAAGGSSSGELAALHSASAFNDGGSPQSGTDGDGTG